MEPTQKLHPKVPCTQHTSSMIKQHIPKCSYSSCILKLHVDKIQAESWRCCQHLRSITKSHGM